MPTLNEDILHHVVTFISSEELHRINSCNPVFYEAWMKSRYHSLTLVKRDKEMKRLLQHLRYVAFLSFSIVDSSRPFFVKRSSCGMSR